MAGASVKRKEVMKAVYKMKCSRLAGVDVIAVEVFKETSDCVVDSFLDFRCMYGLC